MIFMWQITRDHPNGDCIPIASVCIGSLSYWSSLPITASYKYGIYPRTQLLLSKTSIFTTEIFAENHWSP